MFLSTALRKGMKVHSNLRKLKRFRNVIIELRGIWSAEEEEMTGVWRKLHKVELHQFSPDIIWTIKSYIV